MTCLGALAVSAWPPFLAFGWPTALSLRSSPSTDSSFPGVGPVWDGKRGCQVHVRASKGAEPDPRVPLGWPKGDLRGAVSVSREIDRD